MSVYLHDIPLPEAQARLQAALEAVKRWQVLGIEEIRLDENALGRVLAGPVWAKISSRPWMGLPCGQPIPKALCQLNP